MEYVYCIGLDKSESWGERYCWYLPELATDTCKSVAAEKPVSSSDDYHDHIPVAYFWHNRDDLIQI